MAAWLLGVFVLVLLAGLALIRLGWRGRRINRDPVCRDCGFNLRAFRLPEMHGLPVPGVATAADSVGASMNAEVTHSLTLGAREGGESPIGAASSPAVVSVTVTCPECGGGLKRAKAVRIGERKRMPLVAATGLLMALLAIAPLGAAFVAVVTGSDLSKSLPTNVLLWHSRFATREVSRAIAIELESRLLAKKLDTTQASLVVERALELQADWQIPWLEEWGAVIEAAEMNQQFTVEQSKRFRGNAAKVEIVTRERVRPGDPLPVRARLIESRTGPNGTVHASFVISEASLGGVKLEPKMLVVNPAKPPQPLKSLLVTVTGSKSKQRGSYGYSSSQAVLLVPQSISPGEHELVLNVGAKEWGADQNENLESRELRARVTLASPDAIAIEQVPPDAQRSDALAKAISEAAGKWIGISAGNRRPDGSTSDTMLIRWMLQGLAGAVQSVDPSYAAIHANVFLVDSEGRETLVGLLSSEPHDVDEKAGRFGYPRWDPKWIAEPGAAPFELVVRPDPQGAMDTYTIRKLYMGEIRAVIRDVEYQDNTRRFSSKSRAEIEEKLRRQK